MTGNGLGVSRFQEFIEKDKHYWQRGQTFKPKKRQTLPIIPQARDLAFCLQPRVA
jgi:hypothetical protein